MENTSSVISTIDIEGRKVIIPVTDALLEKVLTAVRVRGKADKRWDINIIEGHIAEESVLRLLSTNGATVEVKRDFKSADTGNIAVEGAYKGQPSGITTTEAEWWAYVLDGPGYDSEIIVLLKTERLRKLVSKISPVTGGDNNTASIKLLPVFRLLQKVSK